MMVSRRTFLPHLWLYVEILVLHRQKSVLSINNLPALECHDKGCSGMFLWILNNEEICTIVEVHALKLFMLPLASVFFGTLDNNLFSRSRSFFSFKFIETASMISSQPLNSLVRL